MYIVYLNKYERTVLVCTTIAHLGSSTHTAELNTVCGLLTFFGAFRNTGTGGRAAYTSLLTVLPASWLPVLSARGLRLATLSSSRTPESDPAMRFSRAEVSASISTAGLLSAGVARALSAASLAATISARLVLAASRPPSDSNTERGRRRQL